LKIVGLSLIIPVKDKKYTNWREKMNAFNKIIAIFVGFIFVPMAFASIEGRWVTIDDKTGKKRAVVYINESNGRLTGTIQKVYKQAGDTGVCSKCPGRFKNKPIKGLTFLWGLKKENATTYSGGRILDPKSGKIYRAKVTQKGNKLYVRGYVGVSMLGRTQVWVR
tara:strand:- start:774 stop:1268 length:495 start_codon:yes stop_codon:yes gene_type:complete